MKGLARAARYLSRYRREALQPYLFLIIATLSQLAVPRLVRNVIDAVTRGVIANTIVPRLGSIPSDMLPRILQALGTTQEQLLADQSGAERALISAGIAIVVFASLRGLFAFVLVPANRASPNSFGGVHHIPVPAGAAAGISKPGGGRGASPT